MYQVLARKWRPQSLDELVGQPHVARTLRNALGSRRLAHAYVFAGVRGTGKTTVARILAKSLNCEQGPTATPCNRCVPCVEITEGRALDVMELDAASRTGVDNIRELQEVVSYAPVRDRYRVLIIDEAHMLSKAAFNALLKTLEEPPPQVVFILATTELQRLLPTILSRCQVFEFHRVSGKDVTQHLRRVADAESLVISDRTLERIARAGEGSMRDALSVLERVLAFCGNDVADEDALQILGAVRTEVLVAFIRAFAARDAAALLAALDELVGEGHDLIHFWGELLAVVRDLMLLRAWPGAGEAISRTPEEAAALAEAGGALALEDWTRVFQILAALEYPLKTSSQPRFLFEGALIRVAGLASLRPIEEILAGLGTTGTTGATAPVARTGAVARPAPAPPPQKKNETEPVAARAAVAQGEIRQALVTAVTEARPMLGALLDQAAAIVIDGAALVVTFGPGDDGLRRMLSGDDHTRALEALAAKTFGRPLKLRIAGAPDAPPVASSEARDPIGAEAPKPAPASSPDAESDGGSRLQLMERARRDPGVQRVLREFGAQIIDVRPLRPSTEDDRAGVLEENP